MGRGDRPGNNVNLRFEPYTGHTHRVLDAGLLIDDVFLGQHVDHFAVHGNRYGTGRIDDPFDIGLGNFRPFDGNDASAVEPGDVPPGDTGVHGRNFAAGHQFGFFHRFFDGIHRRFDIDDDPFAKPDRGMGADADDIHLSLGNFAHDTADFGCPDIKAHNQIASSLHATPPSGRLQRRLSPPD